MPAIAERGACDGRAYVAEAADYQRLGPQHAAEVPERISQCTRFYGIFMPRKSGVSSTFARTSLSRDAVLNVTGRQLIMDEAVFNVTEKDHNSVATSHFQLPWVLGTRDMESAMEKLRQFTLAGVADKITCPMLVCWGEEDKLTPREVAHQLYDGVSSKDITLKIFTEQDGGAEHCQVDNRQVGTDYIADWLTERLM